MKIYKDQKWEEQQTTRKSRDKKKHNRECGTEKGDFRIKISSSLPSSPPSSSVLLLSVDSLFCLVFVFVFVFAFVFVFISVSIFFVSVFVFVFVSSPPVSASVFLFVSLSVCLSVSVFVSVFVFVFVFGVLLFVAICSTSPPGGNQVDGLPPV